MEVNIYKAKIINLSLQSDRFLIFLAILECFNVNNGFTESPKH